MKKNDLIHLSITDLTVQGEGIGRYDGMPFFVANATIGDTITAGITKLKKSYGYARLISVDTPSADRVTPACLLCAQCGGCTMMHLSYARQLSWKEEMVQNTLARIGGIPASTLSSARRPIVGMDSPYHYRNKSQYPVGAATDGSVVIGFYAARSHRIIPLFSSDQETNTPEGCAISHPLDATIIPLILAYMKEHGVTPYDEKTGRGLLRHVLLRHSHAYNETMVAFIVNGNRLPDEATLAASLGALEGVVSVVLNENRRTDNVILGEKTRVLWGREQINDTLLGNEFSISARSFYQVNPIATERIYEKAVECAGLTGHETVWDLYCGIGTISLCMAKHAAKVVGIEVVSDAVRDARENARINEVTNVRFMEGRAEDLVGCDLPSPDVVVVDPPRKGLDDVTISAILKAAPKRIVYVSCNPSTLARDIKLFMEGHYGLVEYTPFDAFCFSGHVETVALLSKE